MKYFTTVNDIKEPLELVKEALSLKKNPFAFSHLGKNKTVGLIFMNPSLRTRLSMQKAAQNLGMNVIVMNCNQDGWALEYNDGAIMNGNSVEHIKDAAAVMGMYCDIIAIRCFPGLKNMQEDYSEKILLQFMRYCNTPVISLESSTLHPLQSLADVMTIEEKKENKSPKIVLSWAPHIKPLPQAVANSFSEWVIKTGATLTVACPDGYELCDDYTRGAIITNNQEEALEGADFVYVKNWSSFNDYGNMPPVKDNWLLNEKKMKLTNNAYLMHCLPVRRNVEMPDKLLDDAQSLVMQQAANRVFAAQAVLRKMLEANFKSTDIITSLTEEVCSS